jgi:hypothetical protein
MALGRAHAETTLPDANVKTALGSGFSLVLRRFGCDWQPRLLPAIPSPHQGTGFGPSCLPQLLRHTGAGGFLRSGTVGHYPSVAR